MHFNWDPLLEMEKKIFEFKQSVELEEKKNDKKNKASSNIRYNLSSMSNELPNKNQFH